MPRTVCFPNSRVLQQNIGLIVGRIEGHSQQDEIAPEFLFEPLLQPGKIVRGAKAEVRQGTARVNEVERYNLADKLREFDSAAVLVKQREIRDSLTNG